jgi:hypothetical protein
VSSRHQPAGSRHQIEFTLDQRDEVLAAMAELAASHRGWVNIQPLVEAADMPEQRTGLISGWLTGGLPPLPMGTWTAPTERRGTVRPGSIGLGHGANAKVAQRLVAAGVVMPATWKAVQDNARRGVVLKVPAAAPVAEVLEWILAAIVELTTMETTGEYRATFHT